MRAAASISNRLPETPPPSSSSACHAPARASARRVRRITNSPESLADSIHGDFPQVVTQPSGLMGRELFVRRAAGGHRQGLGADRLGAGDVQRRIAHHYDLIRGQIRADDPPAARPVSYKHQTLTKN